MISQGGAMFLSVLATVTGIGYIDITATMKGLTACWGNDRPVSNCYRNRKRDKEESG